jgi:Leucine-rich repeat (LRR) protein
MSEQLASNKKPLTTMDLKDDELAVSEIKAWTRSDFCWEARKDENGRVVYLAIWVEDEFPSAIAKLTKLKILDIYNYKVKSLPKELWQLSSLEKLVSRSTRM